MSLLLRIAAPVAACLVPLLAGCQSGGDTVGNTTNTAGSITLRDYTQNTKMTLVSDSMLVRMGIEGDTFEERRTAFYSSELGDNTTKACHNDAIAGLMQAFEDAGITAAAIDGPAPVTGNPRDNSIEITLDGSSRHVMKDSSGDVLAFVQCMNSFVEVYNWYQGYGSGTITTFQRPTFGENLGGDR
jgi:hypothetical protein